MMGIKERRFAPLINISLEVIVQRQFFQRHLDQRIKTSRLGTYHHASFSNSTQQLRALLLNACFRLPH